MPGPEKRILYVIIILIFVWLAIKYYKASNYKETVPALRSEASTQAQTIIIGEAIDNSKGMVDLTK